MNRGDVRDLLDRHGLRLGRDRGQNFLVDDAQADRLAGLSGAAADDTVIEVGTGLGSLTRGLAARVHRVVSVEIDSGLVRVLRDEKLLPENVELMHADALALDLAAIVRAERPPVRVVANLPYSAATPLLRRLLDLRGDLVDWSVMVQRELADKLCADSGDRAYSSFTVIHSLCVDVARVSDLSARCFFPVPRVQSSFLRIVPRPSQALASGELAEVERVVRAAFGQRRKTLRNALMGGGLGLAAAHLDAAFAASGIDPRARAEHLEPEAFVALMRALRPEPHGDRREPLR